MNVSTGKSIVRALGALLALQLPLIAWAGNSPGNTSLIETVRGATARYKDINVALAEGWVTATPCVSGPDTGAMGVHLVLSTRINAGTTNPQQPEALIYEPMSNGAMRLVGVEFIVLESVWQAANPAAGSVPAIDGNLMNYIGAPNRYGLPSFYELHVWAWEQNPKGSFADWNTHVSCDKPAN
ncbi:MAG TPA: hypothetical protein VHW71_08710 [Steroidobacteraceae bacterium]|jgi:hypothetical protein|nr:hypothetical protein [Steroidobacteraceae bacterium]